jgi:hypothetical protein
MVGTLAAHSATLAWCNFGVGEGLAQQKEAAPCLGLREPPIERRTMLTIAGAAVLAIAAMIVSFVWPELSPWF